MTYLTIVVHVLLAISVIVLVLLQQGKGAEAGASFGGGASQTVFGSRGSTSFLAKLTGVMAVLLFATSLLLQASGGHSPTVDETAQQTSAAQPASQPETPDSADADTPQVDHKNAKPVDETTTGVDNAAPEVDKTSADAQQESHPVQ